jgi:hypothetical protein
MIICPLCLKDIRPPAEFLLFCSQHPERLAPIRYTGAGDDLRLLHCASGVGCNEPQALWAGVFLAHMGCLVRNPFLDARRVTITDNRLRFESRGGNLLPVEHPQLNVLADIAQCYGDRPEMWFPQGLFRAMNESKRFGRLIMLAGPRQVGKTVISMMAMNPDTYQGPRMARFEPQSFVSLHSLNPQATVPLNSFLGSLHAVTQLLLQRPAVGFVPPTGSEEAHMKAVFLSTSRSGGALERIGGIFRDMADLAFSPQPSAEAEARIHPTVAFFDFAGERFSYYRAHTLEALASKMHAIAVVMEAPDLARFGRQPGTPETDDDPDSVRQARERLNMVPAHTRRCLIVTKLDLIPPNLRGRSANEYLQQLERDEEARLADEPRKLLSGWLDRRLPNEGRLAEILENDRKLPVFFISTHNLDGQGTLGAGGQMPHSVGLRRFLLWALEWLPKQ